MRDCLCYRKIENNTASKIHISTTFAIIAMVFLGVSAVFC